jgi:hypothetical protein
MATAKNIPFKLTPSVIDFFELRREHFPGDFQVSINNIEFDPEDQYLQQEKHLSLFDFNSKDTTVFNFQVGKGKTTLLYQLIKAYETIGCKVIVCSPFIKLILKDKESIIEEYPKTPATGNALKMGIKEFRQGMDKVFYLSNAIKDEVDVYYDQPYKYTGPCKSGIQIMTVNAFLGNAGSDDQIQNKSKREYFHNLLKATEGVPVILVLDELHESIHNFKPELIPNFYKWKGRIHKVIISSATYTPASLPIISMAASLTDNKISVFQLPRTKNTEQANINLHLFSNAYSARTPGIKSLVKELTQKYNEQQRPVHIVAGSKSLAMELANHCYTNKVKDSKEDLSPNTSLEYVNLSTSDTEVPFQTGQNNIGTTFKTGINIDSPDEVLVIILPALNTEFQYKHYGVFSDGISSIIQSIGRLRNGGDLHICMQIPDQIIGDISLYPSLPNVAAESVEHLSINTSFDYLKTLYKKIVEYLESAIKEMEPKKKKKLNLLDKIGMQYKYNFGFWYPNFYEFLLKSGSSKLTHHKNPSYGRNLSPYVYWALIQDQFPNGRLESILLHSQFTTINLQEEKAAVTFINLLQEKKPRLKAVGFRRALNDIIAHLGYHSDEERNRFPILYSIDGKLGITISTLVNKEVQYTKAAVQALYYVSTGRKFPEEKTTYINSCIKEAELTTEEGELIKLYVSLGKLKNKFNQWASAKIVEVDSNRYIPSNLQEQLEENFVQSIRKIIPLLKKEDKVLQFKTFSLLQHVESDKTEAAKKSVFKEFRDLCYETVGRSKQINGEKYIQIEPLSVPANTQFL